MATLRQKFGRWIAGDRSDNEIVSIEKASRLTVSSDREFDSEGLSITLHNANGGHVVSMRRYDRKTDRNTSQLYLITSDQKFDEALAQCIAMECLSR